MEHVSFIDFLNNMPEMFMVICVLFLVNSHDIGHFTQMAYDRATYVGCAFARYTDNYKTGKVDAILNSSES